jgi:hypothetical protein
MFLGASGLNEPRAPAAPAKPVGASPKPPPNAPLTAPAGKAAAPPVAAKPPGPSGSLKPLPAAAPAKQALPPQPTANKFVDLARQRASKLVNFVFTLQRTPSEHEAQERRRCDRLLSFARLLSA